MRVLLRRFVVDVQADADGVLRPRPGAAWRWEPATGEGAVHRGLASLAAATPERIAAFASRHGLLRETGSRVAAIGPIESQRALLPLGQRMADDMARAREKLLAGVDVRTDKDLREVLAFAAVMSELPERVRDGLDRATEGATGPVIEKAIGDALPDPAAFLATFGARVQPYLKGTKPIPAERAALLRGIEALEWFGRLMGGLDEQPEWIGELGGVHTGLMSLFGYLPEALLDPGLINERNRATVPAVEDLARESVEDWRRVARAFASRCSAVRLVRLATGGIGLDRDQASELAKLYRGLFDFDPPTNLSSAEFGDRVQPLLRAECEAMLTTAGVWPIRRGAVAGLYSRALVALWAELTSERPLVACATAGCPGSFVLVHGRLYCDACQADRRREGVRSSRAKAAQRHE